jgi:hypothetical protein
MGYTRLMLVLRGWLRFHAYQIAGWPWLSPRFPSEIFSIANPAAIAF